MSTSDKALGLDRRIDRRDFLDGVALSALAMALGPTACARAEAWPQDRPGYQPPLLTGLRGSHPGSFEAAHAVRDGDFWRDAGALEETDETYDLIVVGGGISGLAAAHFFLDRHPRATVLILDNHDDFGGHAKRNEFHLGGRLHLLNGGTLGIDSPRPYSPVAAGVLTRLGIDPTALSAACNRDALYADLGLRHAVFFDEETFGTDSLVAGAPSRWEKMKGDWPAFLAQAPLSEPVKRDIQRIEEGQVDYLPGLASPQKKDRLSRLSYRDFLLTIAGCDPGVVPFYQTHTHGEWGVGIDAVSALDCWGIGLPGFQGLHLAPGEAPRMGYTPAGYAQTGGSATFHFPDGNASIARLLVRRLIPAAVPGRDCRNVVGAVIDYSRLDQPGQPARIRLSSLCVRARNAPSGVQVAYARGGKVFGVSGRGCVLASWAMMIPWLCPELPAAQKAALRQLVKTPLVYTSVALRDWTAFQRLGVAGVTAPGGYMSSFRLNWPVTIGAVVAERSPEKPILVHMTRTPCKPGLTEFDQNRAGRQELLATPFPTFEREIRSQLGRTLAGGGFDPARDITAITVNRWPHGYAPEYNPLFQADLPPAQQPNVVARARLGRIAIANSDVGRAAYTDSAIDQAWRAVGELEQA